LASDSYWLPGEDYFRNRRYGSASGEVEVGSSFIFRFKSLQYTVEFIVVDPDSDPDPVFQVNPERDPVPGF
jgi:hypothetical protein